MTLNCFINFLFIWHKDICPGFGQDRVNFHRTPGRGTARGCGLNPPSQTE